MRTFDRVLNLRREEAGCRSKNPTRALIVLQKTKGGGLAKGGGDQRSKHRSAKRTGDATPTLADLSISKNESSRVQKEAPRGCFFSNHRRRGLIEAADKKGTNNT